ncbi:nuclear transport factor 2 family protein [Kitasatospora sp. NPDC090308]|uniref:nuclear transport factor 2 family protein n=1 Tax=Kitasatospora sp. NPDC090308 TaxID=3364082 RepID=UPI00382BAC12
MTAPTQGAAAGPDPEELARRYVRLWNEPDPDRRRAAVAELFAPAVAHRTPTTAVDGRAALTERIALAHAAWVRDTGHAFRLLPGTDGHHGVVRLRWEMVRAASGECVSAGTDLLGLDPAGLVLTDHQFIDR